MLDNSSRFSETFGTGIGEIQDISIAADFPRFLVLVEERFKSFKFAADFPRFLALVWERFKTYHIVGLLRLDA